MFIIGLPSPQPIPTPQAYTTGCPRNYTPSDYWRAYDALTSPAASNVNVAIMAEGDPTSAIADFRVNEQGDGLPQVPVVVRQVGLPSPDTAGADEWTLDMTASSGMAGNVGTLYVYATTSLTDSDIALEFNKWVSDDLAQIGNASFGGCEVYPVRRRLDGAQRRDLPRRRRARPDDVLLDRRHGIVLLGRQSRTASTAAHRSPSIRPRHRTSSRSAARRCGRKFDGTYQGESAWQSGGGGLSQFEYSPYWQNGVQPASSTPVGFTFRGVPDISMDGDLQTGMILYISGSWTVIGGTSLSSPLMAGVWAAHAAVASGARVRAAPQLYHTFTASTPGTKLLGPPPTINTGPFHDVISGANGLYSALPGYDYTTGLGTVDVDALNAAIGK